MSAEDPETYLRRFAETQLRRLAADETTAAECAARVDSVAVAFEETGALDPKVAGRVSDDLHLAFAVRSPGRGTSRWRTQISALRSRPGSTNVLALHPPVPMPPPAFAREELPDNIAVVPAGAVLRPRGEDGDEDIYLLSYVSASGRAWFSVAARTSEPLVPRRHASPPSTRNPRVRPAGYRPTFTGNGMTAIDDSGREYDLRFSGGGDGWYLGRLLVNPAPPSDADWLEVHSGDKSTRISLRSEPPRADAVALPLADDPGESYLRRQAESLLGSPNRMPSLLMPAVTGLSVVVPALRAVGLLPDSSPVPGQVAAFIERLGCPGRRIAEPGEMPERWAAAVTSAPPAKGEGPVTAAHLPVVLPEADQVTAYLTGLVTIPGTGSILFGGLRTASPRPGEPIPRRTLWLRDGRGGWHSVSIQGSAGQGRDHTFQATVEPPLGPETSRVEFYVTGPKTEVRADIPVSWWTS